MSDELKRSIGRDDRAKTFSARHAALMRKHAEATEKAAARGWRKKKRSPVKGVRLAGMPEEKEKWEMYDVRADERARQADERRARQAAERRARQAAERRARQAEEAKHDGRISGLSSDKKRGVCMKRRTQRQCTADKICGWSASNEICHPADMCDEFGRCWNSQIGKKYVTEYNLLQTGGNSHCAALTKSGRSCKNYAKNGYDVCGVHSRYPR